MSNHVAPLDIATTYLRLKPDGLADKMPAANFWPDLFAGKYGNCHNEYIVVTSSFDQNWSSWEIHPNGDEIVILLSGAVDFILDTPDGEKVMQVRKQGEYAFVPKGTWHTANPLQPTTMLFITAGEGTYVKPRT
ncbi:MAG TPA: cupin domain-containing protein [Candidatus Acidoferrum sp.]|nr:cupin domain-containing protein [Candidatus Acidoferrum sp.]